MAEKLIGAPYLEGDLHLGVGCSKRAAGIVRSISWKRSFRKPDERVLRSKLHDAGVVFKNLWRFFAVRARKMSRERLPGMER